MERINTIILRLYRENGGPESVVNLLSLLRGIHQLIDRYLEVNGHTIEGRPEDNGRIRILPNPTPLQEDNKNKKGGKGEKGGKSKKNEEEDEKEKKEKEARNRAPVYTVEIELMGDYGNPIPVGERTTIRIPLSRDLYIHNLEIISPRSHEPIRVTFPYNGIDYPTRFIEQISVLTRHLSHGLEELEDQVRNRAENQYPDDVIITLFYCVVLISESARSEYVRAYIVYRNTIAFGNSNPGKMGGIAWAHFRPLLDWGRRAEAYRQGRELDYEPADREGLNKLFGRYGQLSAYFARLRFLEKLRKIKLPPSEACKEYLKFNNERKDDDPDDYPDFERIDNEVTQVINTIQPKNTTSIPADPNPGTTTTSNKKRLEIENEKARVTHQIDILQRMFSILTGKEPETEEYKELIKNEYSLDLNDEDIKEVAIIYRKEMNDSIFEKVKEYGHDVTQYTGEALKTNSVIRLIAVQGSSFIFKSVEKAYPKIVEKIASKLAAKLGAETAGKVIAKKIPILAVGFGVLFGAFRAVKGDWEGAAYEVGSGFAGAIPTYGTAASGAIDAAIALRDFNILKNRIEGLANKFGDAVARICLAIVQHKDLLAKLIKQEQELEEPYEWEPAPREPPVLQA